MSKADPKKASKPRRQVCQVTEGGSRTYDENGKLIDEDSPATRAEKSVKKSAAKSEG